MPRAASQFAPSNGRTVTERMVERSIHILGRLDLDSHRPAMAGSAVDHAAFASFVASSRSARRRILPTFVFGSSLRNSTYFGRL